MKKLFSLVCTLLFMGVLASYAACPFCDKPQPKCSDDKCCCTPDEIVIKEESCCYSLSQTELYKKLGMNQCQMDKACCLYNKYKSEVAPVKEQLRCEKAKLCQMIKGCASKCEIKAQKDKIKCLKDEIEAKFEAYEEGLKCLLTKCQLKEYKKIKKCENKKYKQLKKSNCCCKGAK